MFKNIFLMSVSVRVQTRACNMLFHIYLCYFINVTLGNLYKQYLTFIDCLLCARFHFIFHIRNNLILTTIL